MRHVRPAAQHFHAAFGLGANDTTIATVDANFVALAAIQGLNEKVEERSQMLKAENAELRQELAQLKVMMTELTTKLNGGAR